MALIRSGPLDSGAPSDPALAHGGISPQRMDRTRLVGSSSGSSWRRTAVVIVVGGAPLEFGPVPPAERASLIASIFSASTAGSVVTANRPHISPYCPGGKRAKVIAPDLVDPDLRGGVRRGGGRG